MVLLHNKEKKEEKKEPSILFPVASYTFIIRWTSLAQLSQVYGIHFHKS